VGVTRVFGKKGGAYADRSSARTGKKAEISAGRHELARRYFVSSGRKTKEAVSIPNSGLGPMTEGILMTPKEG